MQLRRELTLALILLSAVATSAAQDLNTFTNGEVADAEKLNENFELIQSAIGATEAGRPRMAWVTISGEVNGYWFTENDNPYLALKLANDSAVYLSPFNPRDPEEGGDTGITYYLESDCQGAAFVEDAYADWLMRLILSNTDYFLKRAGKRSSDAEDLISQSYLWEPNYGETVCENSVTTIDATFWETSPTDKLISDLRQPHTLIWLSD